MNSRAVELMKDNARKNDDWMGSYFSYLYTIEGIKRDCQTVEGRIQISAAAISDLHLWTVGKQLPIVYSSKSYDVYWATQDKANRNTCLMIFLQVQTT